MTQHHHGRGRWRVPRFTAPSRPGGAGPGGGAGRFAGGRRTRPFWGGLFSIVGGLEILAIPLLPLPLLIQVGIAGISRLLMGILMMVMGLSMWVAPKYRGFAGIATILFALASFVTSNLGGFLIGMLLGLVGGALGFAWMPYAPRSDTEPDTEPAAEPEPATDPTPEPEPEPAQGADGAPDRTGSSGTRLLTVAVLTGLCALSVPLGDPARSASAAPAGAPVVNAEVPDMRAGSITMAGLTFDGVVTVPTARGPLRTLKFSMDSVTMRGYELDAPRTGTVGITRLTLQGGVAFYVTRMSGLLGGLVPLTFTPDVPPPVVLPVMEFTEFRAAQVFVRTGTLTAGGLSLRGAGVA